MRRSEGQHVRLSARFVPLAPTGADFRRPNVRGAGSTDRTNERLTTNAQIAETTRSAVWTPINGHRPRLVGQTCPAPRSATPDHSCITEELPAPCPCLKTLRGKGRFRTNLLTLSDGIKIRSISKGRWRGQGTKRTFEVLDQRTPPTKENAVCCDSIRSTSKES